MRSTKQGRVAGGRGGRWAALAAAVAAAAPGATRGAEMLFTDTAVYGGPVATTGAGANAFVLNVPLGATTKQVVYAGPSFTADAPSNEVVKVGLGVFFQAVANGYNGRVVVGPNGGTFDVRGGGSLTNAAASVVVNQTSFFNVDNQNAAGGFGSITNSNDRIQDSIAIALAGGRFQYLGRNSTTAGQNDETVGAVTLNVGQSEVRAERSGGNGANLTLSSLARDVGGTVRFTAGGTIGQSGDNGRIFINGQANDSFVGGWAVVNSTDFANYRTGTTSGGVGNYGGTGFTGYAGGTTVTAANFVSGAILNQGANVTLNGTVSVGALRMSGGATRDLAFTNATDLLHVESGGVLSDGANNARNIGLATSAATRGRITAGAAGATTAQELFLHNNSNTITVNAVVIDNPGGGAVTVVKDLDGTVSLNAANSYTGGTFVTRGTLTAAVAGSLGNGGAVVVKNARLNLRQAGSIAGTTGGGYTLTDQAEVFLDNTATGTGNFNTATDRFTVPAGSTIIGGLAGAASRGLNSISRVGTLTAGGQAVLLPGAIVGHASALNTADNGVNDGTALNTIGGLGGAAELFFGLSTPFNAGPLQGVTLGAGTPWQGMSTDRTDRAFQQGTITLNGDVVLQGLLRDGAYAQLTLGNGTSSDGSLTLAKGTGVTGPVQASVVGRVNLSEAAPSMPSDLTFRVTLGGTLLLSQSNALGGGAAGASNAKVIVEGGATLDPGNVGTSISGNVTLQAGSTLLLNDNVANGPLNGAGTVTMDPGSFLLFAGSPAYNAFLGPQIPTVPAGVVVRLNSNTNYAGTGSGTGAIPSSQAIGINGFSGTNAGGTAATGKAPENVVVEVMSGTNNTITSATGVGTADNLYVSGAVLTSTVTGGTLNQGGGRLIVGPGGLTLAGGASISPANSNNSGATFTLQEDYDLAAGRTLTIGSAATISGLPKANGYVSLTSQGARGAAGSNVNVTNGAQLQLGTFHVVPDLSAVTVNAGTSLLLNRQDGTETIGALAGAGTVAANQTSSVLQVGHGDQNGTFAGSFVAANTAGTAFATQQPNLTKIGGGTLTLTGASTSTGTMNATGGNTVLTGGGKVAFGLVQLNEGGTLTLDNAAGVTAARLGTAARVRLGGGDLAVVGNAGTATTETLGQLDFDGGGLGVVALGAPGVATAGVTLNVPANTQNRSITTTILRGDRLGSGAGGGARFTVNSANLSGSFAAGQVTTGVRPDILTDTPAAGGTTAELAFTTYDPANGFRRMTAAEYTPRLFAGQGINNNVRLAIPQALAFPVSAVPGQQPTFGGDTTLQSLTLDAGGGLALDPTPTVIGGLSRLNINSNGILVHAGANATVAAPFVQGSLYATTIGNLTVTGAITNGSVVKAGAGTLMLGPGAVNRVDGNIAVNEGTLVLGAGSSIYQAGSTSYNGRNLFLAGGTLDLGGNASVFGTFTTNNYGQGQPGVSGNLVSTGGAANLALAGGTFTGTASGLGNVLKYGTGTQVFGNAVTMAGTLTVRGGVVDLRNQGRITGATAADLYVGTLSLNNVDTLNANNYGGAGAVTDRFPSNAPITLRGSTLQFRTGGGVAESQSFGNVTAALGTSFVDAGASGNSSAEVTLAAFNRDTTNPGTAVNFQGANLGFTGDLYQVARIAIGNYETAAPPPLSNNILGPWAVVNGSNWATYVQGRGVGSLGNTGNGFAAYSANALTAGVASDNINVTGAVTDTATARTINTLRLGQTFGFNVTLANTETLTLAGGGLLSDVNGGVTIGPASGQTASLTAGAANAASELYAWVNQSTTTVSARVVNNGSGPLTLVKSGPATLALTGANAYTGNTIVNQGTLLLNTATANGGSTVAVPGNLVLNGNVQNTPIVTANTAGQIATSATVTFNGGGELRLNETAAGTTTLGGLTFNNIGGATPVVRVANLTAGGNLVLTGDVAAVNNQYDRVPTINQNLGTANTTLAQLDLDGGTRTFDVAAGLSPLGLNVQTGIRNGGIVKAGAGVLGLGVMSGSTTANGNLSTADAAVVGTTSATNGATTTTLQFSKSTLTGGITVNGGAVRIDSPGALGGSGATGGNLVTVNPGGVLLANVNSPNLFNSGNNPAAPTPITGNLALNGGTLQSAIGGTATFDGSVSLAGTSAVKLEDYFFGNTQGRNITLAGPVTAAAGSTLTVSGAASSGSVGTLRLQNPGNNFAAATLAIGPNLNVTAQNDSATNTHVGTTIAGAAVTMTGGQLNIRADALTGSAVSGQTFNFDNNLTVTGKAVLSVDRSGGTVNNNTIRLGSLTLSDTLTVSSGNGYRVTFNGGTTLANGADVVINNNGPVSLGTVTGAPASFTKFGNGRSGSVFGDLNVASWPATITGSTIPFAVGQGPLITTSGNGTAALSQGPLTVRHLGTVRNNPGSATATVNYNPSLITSEGLLHAQSGVMNLSGKFVGAPVAVAANQPFSAMTERFFTAASVGASPDFGGAPSGQVFPSRGDPFVAFENATGTFLTANPVTTGTLNNHRLSLTGTGVLTRARLPGATNTNIGAAWQGTFTVGGPTGMPEGPVSFGLNPESGATLYVDLDRDNVFEANELVVSARGDSFQRAVVNTTTPPTAGDYKIAIGWFNANRSGFIEARYFPGAMGAGVTPTPTSGTGSPLQVANGFQPVPFDNQFVINPGTTQAGGVQVDANAQMLTGGFGVETVLVNASPAATASRLLAGGPAGTASAAQILFVNGSGSNNTARLEVAAGNTVTVGQGIGIANGVTLLKQGTGDLVINATNAAGTGTLDVQAGTLRGSGSIAGPLTMRAGTTLAPGNSPGILGTGNLTLTAGSQLAVELNGPDAGTGYDQVNVTGTVALGGADLLVSLGFAPAPGSAFVIINNDAADAVAGTFNGMPEGHSFTLGGTELAISYTGGSDANDVVLTAVPEPASLAVAGLAAVGLLARRRRNRR